MNSTLKHHARTLLLALLPLAHTLLLSNAAAQSLTNYSQEALATAVGAGGAVLLARDGTITLSSPITNFGDITLDGSGHQVTVSGGGAASPFCVAANARLTLLNLTLADGWASNGLGGAILVAGGTLNVTNCAFVSNLVTNTSGGPSRGGAVFNANGQVVLEGCSFTGNVACGADATSASTNDAAAGGGIWSDGALTVSRCTFVANSASGGSWSWQKHLRQRRQQRTRRRHKQPRRHASRRKHVHEQLRHRWRGRRGRRHLHAGFRRRRRPARRRRPGRRAL